MSNLITGINLTTLAAGLNTAPIQSNSNLSSLPGGCLPSTCSYAQISVSTTTNNSLSLPVNPILGQNYTIRNDGSSLATIFPGSSSSSIIGSGGTAVGTIGVSIAEFGNSATFVAISNTNALNTALTSSALNNPAVVWHVTGENIVEAEIVFVLPVTTPQAATIAQSSSVFIIPALSNNIVFNLPVIAGSAGTNYKFVASATLGFTLAVTAQSAVINGVVDVGAAGAATQVTKANATTITFAATALTGDYLNIVSDGAKWYISGNSSAAAGFS